MLFRSSNVHASTWVSAVTSNLPSPDPYPCPELFPPLVNNRGFPGGSDNKVSAFNVGDLGLIPGAGRSSGEGNGNLLQYSCLENSMDGGAWWAAVHGVAKSRTRLIDSTSRVFGLSQWLSECKESACNAGDLGSIPGSGRSSGEGNGNLLQYSCLEKSMDREA